MRVFAAFVCLLLAPPARPQQPVDIEQSKLAEVLPSGARAKVVLRSGVQVDGTIDTVGADSVAIRTPAAVQRFRFADIRTVTVQHWAGKKRKWLPIVLAGTLGAFAFVAAGATEERKASYLPLAVGFTAGLAIGGYYGGRALDRREVTYTVQ